MAGLSYTDSMVKKNSYVIPRSFQLFFIITAALAYIGNTVPYVMLLTQQHTIYDSLANTTLFVAAMIVPVAVGLVAVAFTHRRGLGRWWVAAGAAFVAILVAQLFMWLGSIAAPMNYEWVNIAAYVLAVALTFVAVWYDRVRLAGRLRYWRIIGMALLYATTVIAGIVDTLRMMSQGSVIGDSLIALAVTLGVIALFASVALYIYRRLPLVERVKRVLLALTSAVLATMAFGGLMTALTFSQAAGYPDWFGIVMAIAVYCGAIWWLLPSVVSKRQVAAGRRG